MEVGADTPKAEVVADEEPKADFENGDGANAVGAVRAEADPSEVASPGYDILCLIEALYISHQEHSTPSCVSIQYPGRGLGDSSSSSSEGIGF